MIIHGLYCIISAISVEKMHNFYPYILPPLVWLSGRVVKAGLATRSRGFNFRLPRCRLQPLASCLYTCASIIKQYNLVLANGRCCSAAAEESRTWWKVIAAYRRVYGFGHLRADCRGPGSSRLEYGTTFLPPPPFRMLSTEFCKALWAQQSE